MSRPSEKWSARRTLLFIVVTCSLMWALIIGSVGLIVERVRG